MDFSYINDTIISEATSRNWKRLHSSGDGKLVSRANKQRSMKMILPLEYFSNKSNVADIQRFIKFCKDKNFKVENVLYSVGIGLFRKIGILEKPHVQKILDDSLFVQEVADYQLPDDEFDLLGLIYQCFLLEGEKNRKGSYYTPSKVAKNMTKDLDFSGNQTFFDPCCGSGAFMLSLKGASPSQIFGCDNDPLAVMMAKINLLIKFPAEIFEPQIFRCDFLNTRHKTNFTYIVSNPPWGAIIFDEKNRPVITKESYSLFFEKAFQQLDNEGVIRFLLPESILNVKCHKNFRKFLLEDTDLTSITLYPDTFSGVQTKFIDVSATRHLDRYKSPSKSMDFFKNNNHYVISKSSFYLTNNLNFNLLTPEDEAKLKRIFSIGRYTLKDSIWALGVITGDNKRKIKKMQGNGMEPIYTGKEIEPFSLKNPKYYIKYKRSDFQQVAKDEIYRSDEKLVYKFISKDLVFAYDNSKSLFLNSANILIPNVPGMSVKTVLAFLNSDLYQFIYKSLFGEIKILKGNLMELPFPEISAETDKKLTRLVDDVLSGDKNALKNINDLVCKIFEINYDGF